MKYSLNLLKHFISVQDTEQNIANNLTLKSCEIEHVYPRKIPQDVVIGKVTDVAQHPDADKLVVCQIDCGGKGSYQIVTGGENVQKDTYVPVAIPGCYLPSIDLKITGRTMRGVESNGMICAKEELGIQEDMDKHRIWTLNEDFQDIQESDLGISFGKKYPWLENTIFDVDNKTLTHRPDLTGYFGVAMELQAIYKNLGDNHISFNKVSDYASTINETNILQQLENAKKGTIAHNVLSDRVRSYSTVMLENITIKESSLYTRQQLRDIESTPRNNWVDFSNIFMNLTGQPIHFFDADTIKGEITVRQAKQGEQFIDLFDVEHTLTQEDIVICDEQKILAIAGVIGGKESGVQENTKNILVEIANFDPVSVRKTALRLATRTDASMRFEKNINPIFSLHAVMLFLDIMQLYQKDLGEYNIQGINHYKKENQSIQAQRISLNEQNLIQTIRGINEDDVEQYSTYQKSIINVLKNLGFGLHKNIEKEHTYTVSVPHWRGPTDIQIAHDIYEEIARIVGYDSIPSIPLQQTVHINQFPIDVATIRTIEESMSDKARYTQLETYPWTDHSLLENIGGHTMDKEHRSEQLLSLENALSPETKNLRDSMLYGLFQHIAKNHKFFENASIYDIGKVRKDEQEKVVYGVQGKDEKEQRQLGAVHYQKKCTTRNDDALLKAKATLQQVLIDAGLTGKVEYTKTDNTSYHPKKQGMILYNRKPIGFLGQIHPLVLNKNKIDQNAQVVFFSIDIDVMMYRIAQKKTKKSYDFATLQDQIIKRDLCFVIDQQEDFSGVLNAVKKVKNIQDIHIFDLYQGKHLPEDKKSVALSIIIKGDGNMTTEAINNVMNKAIEKAQKAGGELRQ